MTYKSTAIINKEGKWFVARSVELGVVSQGRTVEEARKNLEEAVGLYES
ncbi:type II toxin-antitoxin system HicB family antitoxin [bacterium]|nr:MAG: type II toxin-antitoxin system HicB family antitoxin [bacterium]